MTRINARTELWSAFKGITLQVVRKNQNRTGRRISSGLEDTIRVSALLGTDVSMKKLKLVLRPSVENPEISEVLNIEVDNACEITDKLKINEDMNSRTEVALYKVFMREYYLTVQNKH